MKQDKKGNQSKKIAKEKKLAIKIIRINWQEKKLKKDEIVKKIYFKKSSQIKQIIIKRI